MTGFRDDHAAELLRLMREQRGLSPEQVPFAMHRAGVHCDHIPSARTIRRVEEVGMVPQVRFRFGLAQFYGRELRDIWSVRRRARSAA